MAFLLSSAKNLLYSLKSAFSNKAYFETEKGKKLHVQFNPEQFRITRTAQYSSEAQKEQPYIVFSGTVVPQMEIQFFFDTSGSSEITKVRSEVAFDVSQLTAEFENLVYIEPSMHRPTIVTFHWGKIEFPGFVKSVSTTFTVFEKDGMPVRAMLDAQIMGIPTISQTKIPLQSPDRTKSRVVSEDTNIWHLADAEYDDIGQWRAIAKANGIMDPFDVPAGTVLKVPAL